MSVFSPFLNKYRIQRRRQRLRKSISDPYWQNALILGNFDLFPVTYSSDGAKLRIDDLDISLEKGDEEFFLRGLQLAVDLYKISGAKFGKSNGALTVRLGGLELEIETRQELFILHEIFCDGVYNIVQTDPVVMVDVGMNVGYASLFFAAQENVREVYAYEPFKPTYDQAVENFRRNAGFAEKVKHFNFGLGASDEFRTVAYSSAQRGTMGIDGLLKHKANPKIDGTERIELRNVSDVVRFIHSQCQGARLIAKIDTEGSEYQIIETLASDGILSLFDAIMLEWHDNAKNHSLMSNLLENGFGVLSLKPNSPTVGAMYAFKRPRRN